MNEQQLQQAFIQFLAQKTGAKTQQELEAAIQQLGEQGLQQAYQEFMQLMQDQQVQAAKFGAKLNYIRGLRGHCPEGYELQYYKSGGQFCKKCMKKQQEGGKTFQNPIEQFKHENEKMISKKCGGKTKKKKKKEGGELNSTYDPKSFSKMTLAKCGTKLKEACKGIKMNQKGTKIKPKQDQATRDSIAANKYNDQEVQSTKPGTYKKNKQGKLQWTPDRTKAPYNKK